MNIYINGQNKTIEPNSTVRELLTQIGSEDKGIAVAINNEVVSKNNWENHIVNEEDKVLLIKATPGG